MSALAAPITVSDLGIQKHPKLLLHKSFYFLSLQLFLLFYTFPNKHWPCSRTCNSLHLPLNLIYNLWPASNVALFSCRFREPNSQPFSYKSVTFGSQLPPPSISHLPLSFTRLTCSVQLVTGSSNISDGADIISDFPTFEMKEWLLLMWLQSATETMERCLAVYW